MADPLSWAAIGTTVAGGIISGMGASKTASANAQTFNYKAGIAQLNQTIAKQNEAWAVNSGGIKAVNQGLKSGQMIGDTKAKQGASGVDVNTGSSADVRDTQGDVARYEQGIIRADTAHTAYGYEVEGAKAKAEEGLDTSSASNAIDAGRLGVLASVIGTAGSVASKWTQGNTIGLFGAGSGGSNATDGIGGFGPTAPSWST